MINNQLDIDKYSAILKEKGRVQIPNFLENRFAEVVLKCLLEQLPWDLAYFENDGGKKITADKLKTYSKKQLNKIHQQCFNIDKDEYMYLYNTFMMVTAYLEKREPHLIIHKVLELFNSPQYIQLMKKITGDSSLKKINAQATRYLPGHFLRPHNDFDANEGRRYAYVLNLTKSWRADWGGLLHFQDDNGGIEDVFTPSFNTLNIFQVPKTHYVSQVSTFAKSPRLAITGWMLDK